MAAHPILRLAAKRTLRVAGLMSGTSADGVDAALADVGPRRVRVLGFETFPYPTMLRDRIFRLFEPETARVDEICHYNFVLGEVFASAVLKLSAKLGVGLSSIDLIGSHGQTIQHIPQPRAFGRRRVRSTLQIGEPSVIAERTGITTVADFRPRDVAAGGQGAPLVPYADSVLFAHDTIARAVQNIGGIANVSYLPAGRRLDGIVAFDTGPGNMVIDRVAALASAGSRRLDAGGELAAMGKVHAGLLAGLKSHEYFRRRPPKSTGREEFGVAYSDRAYFRGVRMGIAALDILATVTALTAGTIADAYRDFLPAMPEEVILCGGGAHNHTLLKMLQQRLGSVPVRLSNELGVAADAKEAVCFAVLAAATVRGTANNVPSATGAARPAVLGKIIPGTNRT